MELKLPLSLARHCRVVAEGRCMEHKARAFLETLGLTLILVIVLIPAAVLIIAGYTATHLYRRSELALRTVCKHLGIRAFAWIALTVLGRLATRFVVG
jgi:hypothetical protein